MLKNNYHEIPFIEMKLVNKAIEKVSRRQLYFVMIKSSILLLRSFLWHDKNILHNVNWLGHITSLSKY